MIAPRHTAWMPGLAAVLAAAVAVVLAHGVPGSDPATHPGKVVLDQQLQRQLREDEHLTVLSDPAWGEATPQSLGVTLTSAPPDASGNPDARLETPSRTGKPRVFVRPRPYVRDFRAIALREAKRAHIKHPQLFVRQIAAESGYQPCVRSGAGAIGIAQIMPATAKSWHVDPYVPESALRVAAQHMAKYERHYGSYSLALAAYNAGPGAVAKAGNRVPPYAETRRYVAKITNKRVDLLGLHQVYRLPAHEQASFARKLQALRKDVHAHGGRLMVSEGWRSYDDQLRLWKAAKKKYGRAGARNWVAPPGCSNHNRGYAADLYGSLDMAHELAPRHGLRFPLANENWHIEPIHLPATWVGS